MNEASYDKNEANGYDSDSIKILGMEAKSPGHARYLMAQGCITWCSKCLTMPWTRPWRIW